MKRLMIALLIMVAMICMACGGSGGSSDSGDSENKVTVTGDIYNQAVMVAGLDADIRAAVVNIPWSMLNSLAHNEKYLRPISQSGTIMLELTCTNNTAEALRDMHWAIGFESDTFLTREEWQCMECFSKPGEKRCNGYSAGLNGWMIEGGFFHNTVESPRLSACDDTVAFGSGTCHTLFLPGFNCNTPSYEIEHTEAGDGVWKAEGTIASIRSGETVYGYASTTLLGSDIRDNHLAYFMVNTPSGRVLGEEYYIFDLTL